MNDRHLANHFSYLTNSPPLNTNVEKHIKTQIGKIQVIDLLLFSHIVSGYFEKFLEDQCRLVEYRDQMEAVEATCQLENNGSETLKYIHILVSS